MLKRFFKAVLPSMLAFAFSGLYTIVDGFFIGRNIGDLGLAAVNIAYPMAALVQAAGTGIGMGGAVWITLHRGKQEEGQEMECLGNTMTLLLSGGLLVMALLFGVCGPVLRISGAEGRVYQEAMIYIQILAGGSLLQFFATGFAPLIRNYDGAVTAMISMIAGYVMLGIFSDNIIMVFVALVLFYVPGTLIQMTAILSLTDSIEYGQLKNGKRNEAVTLSVRPMLDKIGGALSNGITGFIAVAAGMTGSATAADMTPANIHTFEVCAFYVPLVLIVLSLLVFTFKVKINEKMHAEIVEQLEAKLAAGEISDEEAKTVETVEAINEKAKLTE